MVAKLFFTYKWLLLILVLAGLLRLIGLSVSPPGLNWDEASIGYNAYSVLKTGRDEWGEFLPLSFKAFGEYKLPGLVYASIPGIALFGTTDFGVRVTPAVIGVLGVLLMYLLGKKLLLSERGALSAALLMAISPWAVHFSRISFEAGLAMVLTMVSLYFLSHTKTRHQHLWLSMFFAVLALYTYNSVRILLPLLFLAYLQLGVINWRRILPVLAVGLVLTLPLFNNLLSQDGRVRWGTVSLASQKSFTDNIAQSRGYTQLPNPLPRLIHNKVTHYLFQTSLNYLQIFSTEFLFFKGETNTQRSTQGMGLLYIFELPLLVLGLISLMRDQRFAALRRLLLPWLLLAPLPSIITIDSPSSVRALGMLPPILLIEGLGAMTFWHWLSQHRGWLPPIMLFATWNVAYFIYLFWFVYPVKYSDQWLYGYRQAVDFAVSNYPDAKRIYLTAGNGEPYIFTLFYSSYNPQKFQQGRVDREVDPTGWVHVTGFDKYTFTNFSGLDKPQEIVARNTGQLVMITGFAQLPSDYHRDLIITAPNWKVMFEGTIQEGKL